MYFNVWKNGVASGLVDYLYGVVQRKADRSKLPPAGEWAAVPFGHHGDKEFIDSGFLAKREYQHVEYLLVEEDEPALIEGFKQVKQGPPWYLFQRVHDDSAPR